MKRHILRLLLVTAALGMALPALAAEDTRCGNPPRAKWLASKTVKDKLTAIGLLELMSLITARPAGSE